MGGWAGGLAEAWWGGEGNEILLWDMEDLPERMRVAHRFANAVVCLPRALCLLGLSITRGPSGEL